MTTARRLLLTLCLVVLGTATAADLDATGRLFLQRYEKIRSALAADQLPEARTAAQELPEAATIAEAKDLTSARKAFKALSAKAVALARGQPGYFIAHCSMFPGGADWVQTTDKVSNPYWGRSMPHCGEIVK